MNLARLLERTARLWPERPAIFHGDAPYCTYGEWAERAGRIAGAFAQQGFKPGDRVALFMTNSPEYLEVMYGAWWAGLTIVPVNAKLHPEELAYVLADSEATALFVSADLAPGVTPLLGRFPGLRLTVTPGTAAYTALTEARPLPLVARQPEDLAWLFYTSGITGRPKGVMLTQRNLSTMAACYFMDFGPVEAGDASVYAAPMSHGAGIYNLMYVIAGARHVVPCSGGFDEAELIGLSQSVGQLCLFAAPTMVRRLVEAVAASGADPAGFLTIVYGGGPMYVEDLHRGLEVMGDCFMQVYGQGESPMCISVLTREQLQDSGHPRWAERLASVGVAQALVEIKIGDEEGRELPCGAIGEVMVRGDSVMAGYWRNPDATAAALQDGWLRTGDVGSLDEDGFLTLRDRSKDVIISGGTNIYPREVEEILLRSPLVQEVSVIGLPDPEWGEIVVACVVGHPAVSAETLDALCLDHLARFKRPRQYHFLDSLPKNNYGKVLKTELRARFRSSSSSSSGPMTPSTPEVNE